MSSYPTAATSMTRSSTSCSSRREAGSASPASRPPSPVSRPPSPSAAVIACGALGGHIREITARRGWPVEVHSLPSLLHNHPERIAPAAERPGPAGRRGMFEREPGTYLLTDFWARSFRRSVLAELGRDSRPELWPDYFGHYRRVVWLAQSRDAALDAEAAAVAEMFGLPLTVIDVGTGGLERELGLLLAEPDAPPPDSSHPAQPLAEAPPASPPPKAGGP